MVSDVHWAPETLLNSLHLLSVYQNLWERFEWPRCQRVAGIAREVDGKNEFSLIKKKKGYQHAATVALFALVHASILKATIFWKPGPSQNFMIE